MSLLDRIMARKREEVAEARRLVSESRLLHDIHAGRQLGGGVLAPVRGFADALMAVACQAAACHAEGGGGKPAIIAEIKRASPSKGRIVPDHLPFDPAYIARRYAAHGATCLSCLTDRDFFMGDDAFLEEIKRETPGHPAMVLPVLRKEFVYDPYQVVQARALGADAILLILAVLEPAQARELEGVARELGLDVLVEVHDAWELEVAHDLHTPLLGINNRNLTTFETSLETSLHLARRVEAGRVVISESGIRRADDVRRLQAAGIQAFLVGEVLMRQEDPGAALGHLLAQL